MILSDGSIKRLIDEGVLADAEYGAIGPVSYDLRTASFNRDGSSMDEVSLMPGDSVFVSSVESIHLPNDIAARVMLRNSRIRQGLTLDAPLYFPGHETTIFFRVTNVSASEIHLDTKKGIAQVSFETVDHSVDMPYSGTFNKEFDFRNLADYTDVYSSELREIEDKKDEIKGLETRIYGNVMALLAVIAAVFTLVNVNAGIVSGGVDASDVVVSNLMVVGGFSILSFIIKDVIANKSGEVRGIPILVVGIALIIAAVAFAAIF